MSYEVEIKSHDMGVDDKLNDYVLKKTDKLDRYISNIQSVSIELAHNKTARQADDRYVCQITLRIKGKVLRAEERSDDIYVSFDSALGKLNRRIERFKGKHYRGRGDGASLGEIALEEAVAMDEEFEDEEPVIARRKHFTLMPMVEEEAIEQMNLLGHEDFFVFYNMDSGAVNVLYKRRDGSYGLIETELG